MKKVILFLLFAALAVSFFGCNTIKGASDGFVRDVSDTWQNTKDLDSWLQENAW